MTSEVCRLRDKLTSAGISYKLRNNDKTDKWREAIAAEIVAA